MEVRVHGSIAEIAASDWNRVAGDTHPFMSHEFLLAAETSGSATAETDWQPRHLSLRTASGALRGVLPLYEKPHSWGEFVFDWAWADAYRRAGLNYYPKLVSAVPFTPFTWFRIFASKGWMRGTASHGRDGPANVPYMRTSRAY